MSPFARRNSTSLEITRRKRSRTIGPASSSLEMARNESISRPTNLTLDQRTRIFDKTVAKVTKDYFDPKFNGTDWPNLARQRRDSILALDDPEKFELGMHDLVRSLGTSHTGFFHQSVRRVPGRLSIGVSFRRAETENGPQWVAQDVHEGGPGQAAGLRPLDVLKSINGTTIVPPDVPMFPMGTEVNVLVQYGSSEIPLSCYPIAA